MRVTRIENTSDHDVTIEHADGTQRVLKPGHKAMNLSEVRNIEELRREITVIQDLSEITGG